MTVSKSFWFKDWPEEGKKGQRGNFSNDKQDTFRPEKGYVGVRLQQGVPLLDRDWNELEDIRRYQEMMLRKLYLGDGTPNDGFKISAFDPPKNDIKISQGRLLVDGLEVVNEPGWPDYKESYGENKLTRPRLGSRKYAIYLDAWVEEVLEPDDEALGNPQDVDMETCIRHRHRWNILVDEGSDGISNEDGHHCYKLAEITRHANRGTVIEADIKDLRSNWQSLDVVQKRLRSHINSVLRGELPSEPEIVLTPNIQFGSFQPKVLKDRSGCIWYFWTQEKYSIRCRRRVSGKWLPEKEIASGSTAKTIFAPFEDANGRIWLFWTQLDEGTANLYCSNFISGEWEIGSQITKSASATDKQFKRPFSDSNGVIWTFWSQTEGANSYLYSKKCIKGIWEKDEKLFDAKYEEIEQLFADSKGNIWIFYRQNNNIYFKLYISERWEENTLLAPVAGSIVDLFDDGKGNIWLFWWPIGGSDSSLLSKTWSEGKWGKNLRVIPPSSTDKAINDIFAGPNGDIWAFWTQDSKLFYNRYTSGQWNDVGENLAENFIKVFPCSNGDLCFIWRKNDSYVSKIFDPTWGTNGRWLGDFHISDSIPVKIIETSKESIWVLFRKQPFGNIWCSRYMDGDWLDEVRLVGGKDRKESPDIIEDPNGGHWLFWVVPGAPSKAMCKRCYDEI